jgi:hypothetical protein
MPEPGYRPTDPDLKAQLAEWRAAAGNFPKSMPPWLWLTSLTAKTAVLVLLLLMAVVGWGVLSIWITYGGAIYLALVTFAVPLWIAYMFWAVSRR